MNDANQQRLIVLRAKLRRINGHKELTDKLRATADALCREIAELDGTDIEALLDALRKGHLPK